MRSKILNNMYKITILVFKKKILKKEKTLDNLSYLQNLSVQVKFR